MFGNSAQMLPVRQINRLDLLVQKSRGRLDHLRGSSDMRGWTLIGPFDTQVRFATNDHGLGDFMRDMFKHEESIEVDDLPDLVVALSESRRFMIDVESGSIELSGPCVPFTLVKQAWRWLLAHKSWRMRSDHVPLHATVVEGPRGAVAIVGQGQVGKSYLTNYLLQQLRGIRLVSDDWGLLNVKSRSYARGTERFLHVRQGEEALFPFRSSMRMPFEIVVDEQESVELSRECRDLVQSELPASVSVPVAGMVILVTELPETNSEEKHGLRGAFRRDLYDQSLQFLPEDAIDWFLALLMNIQGVAVLVEQGYGLHGYDYGARDSRVLAFASSVCGAS